MAVLLPFLALALGLVAVLVAETGAKERPLAELAVVVAGVAAALAPLRYGLPLAVVLSTFGGFLLDFAGGRALYWNEAFVLLLIARSAVVRRPSAAEAVAAAGVVGMFGAYVLAGTDPTASLWGAKILLTSVAAGWAIARSDVGWREWKALQYALSVAVGANVVLALWQHSKGVSGLSDLGLEYGERIRETAGGGAVRAFGGFTSPAALSYTLAIAICTWTALALGRGAATRGALTTPWVPAAAGAGILLAVDRTALIALLAALLVLAVTFSKKILVPVAAVVLGVGVGFGAAVSPERRASFESSASARLALWQEHLRDFRPFGRGPATAGSAYKRVEPPGWVRPFQVPHAWRLSYDRMEITGSDLSLVQTRIRPRPPLSITASVRAADEPARLRVSLERESGTWQTLFERDIRSMRERRLHLKIPRGPSPSARVWFVVTPVQEEGAGARTLEVRQFRVHGLPEPRTPAEQVWQRWFEKTPAALQSDGPGLVDNLYVSWAFQYGIAGVALCALWATLLLWPTILPRKGVATTAAALVGVFLVVAAVAVNVWEEAPVDFLVAVVFALA